MSQNVHSKRVHYNGPPTDENFLLVGRTFRKRAFFRRERFFFYAFPTVFREQNEQN